MDVFQSHSAMSAYCLKGKKAMRIRKLYGQSYTQKVLTIAAILDTYMVAKWSDLKQKLIYFEIYTSNQNCTLDWSFSVLYWFEFNVL